MKQYIAVLVAIGVLDLLWLGVFMTAFYRGHLSHLMNEAPVWPAAIVFYLLYAAGIMFFAVSRASSLKEAACRGAFLGVLCYGTYDLTNHATLASWPLAVTLVDIVWGAVVTAVATAIGYQAAKRH